MNWFLSLSTALISWVSYQESIKIKNLPSPEPQVILESQIQAEEKKQIIEPLPDVLSSTSKNPLDQINQYRKSHGLSEASEQSDVCSFAKLRVQEISHSFDHNGFIDRINNNSLPYSSYSLVTENIAQVNDINLLVDMWIASPTHEENIRKDTPFICIENIGDYYVMAGYKP